MKNHKPIRVSLITWEIFLILSLIVVALAGTTAFIPRRWWLYATIADIILLLLTFLLAYFAKKRGIRRLSSGINIFLSIIMLALAIVLPYVRSRVDNIVNTDVNKTSVVINVYAMTDDYKKANASRFTNSISGDQLSDYANGSFIVPDGVDQENSDYALEQIAGQIHKTPATMKAQDLSEAGRNLYQNKGAALVLSETYASVLSDMDEFQSFNKDTKIIASFTRTVEVAKQEQPKTLGDTFSIYIAGSDTRSGNLSTTSRFDVNMVATVNTKTHEVMITSIPRDSYISNPARGNAKDKLTHMGISGVNNSVNALNQWLGIDINNYAIVNFATFSRIIDALGGVTVDNPYAFVATNVGGVRFPKGEVTLTGNTALAYVRERYSLPNGDFDRNMHQTLVLRAILSKLASAQMLTRLPAVMDSLSGSFLTDADVNRLYQIASDSIDSGASWKILTQSIKGSTGSAVTASMPGSRLSVVFPSETDRSAAVSKIQAMQHGQSVQ